MINGSWDSVERHSISWGLGLDWHSITWVTDTVLTHYILGRVSNEDNSDFRGIEKVYFFEEMDYRVTLHRFRDMTK